LPSFRPRHEVVGAEGKPPLFGVFAMRWPPPGEGVVKPEAHDDAGASADAADRTSDERRCPACPVETICVRDRCGRHTPEYTRIMLDMGIPPPP